MVIDAALAAELDDPATVELGFGGRPEEWTVVGVAGFGDQDSLGGAGFVLFELGELQAQLDAIGELDTIDVAAAADVEVDVLVERITSVLPEGTEAVSSQSVAQEQAAQFQEALGFFNTFLLVFAGISLFVSTFIIQNTFRIVVAQRTQELALLRAVGAGGGQVTRMVLTEAALVGLLASAIGLLVGLGLALAVRWLIDRLGVSLPEGDLVVEPRTLLVAAGVGLVVTLISAVLPALRAARVPPVAAMRLAEPSGRESTGRPLIGLALALAGAAAVSVGLFVNQDVLTPITLVGGGVAVLFIGLAALSPRPGEAGGGGIGRAARDGFRDPGTSGGAQRQAEPTPDCGHRGGTDDRCGAGDHVARAGRLVPGHDQRGSRGHLHLRPGGDQRRVRTPGFGPRPGTGRRAGSVTGGGRARSRQVVGRPGRGRGHALRGGGGSHPGRHAGGGNGRW